MQSGSWQPHSRKPPLHRGCKELSRALIHGLPNRQTVALFLHSRKKRIKKGRGCVFQDCKIILLQALSPRGRWQWQERAPRGLLGFSVPMSSPRVLQGKTSCGSSLTGKQKRKETPGLFFSSGGTACECRSNNSSRNMELESFQLPNSTRASAVCFVLLIHPQGYFCFLPPGRTGFILFSMSL